jgi:stearoyl-CoA desaturase (delta-9 desaturase)
VPKSVRYRGVGDLLRDKICIWFNDNFYKVIWATWCLTALIDTDLFLGLGLAQLYAFHQESLVNLLCHQRGWWGYRTYETGDNSVNVLPLGWLTWGQAFHNNHHEFPARYDFGVKWWEVDPAAYLVNLIRSKA